MQKFGNVVCGRYYLPIWFVANMDIAFGQCGHRVWPIWLAANN